MSLLTGKTGLIIGVANKHSIAWAIAQSAAGQGAKLLFNYQSERLREKVEELVATMPGAKAFPCDVGDDAQIAALMQSVGKETSKSKVRSATSCLSLLFSSSSCRNRRISGLRQLAVAFPPDVVRGLTDPELARHL